MTDEQPDSQPASAPSRVRTFDCRYMDSSGKPVEISIAAESAADAIALLEKLGMTRVRVVSDRGEPKGGGDALAEGAAKCDAIMAATVGLFSWQAELRVAYYLYRKAFLVAVLVAIVMAVARFDPARPWRMSAALLALAAPMPFAVWFAFRVSIRRPLQRIQRAYMAGQFDDVLVLVDQFKARGRKSIPEDFLASLSVEWRSRALAQLGQVPQALDAIAALTNRPAVGRSSILLFKAAVYSIAHDFAGMHACLVERTKLEPNNPMVWISLADFCADHAEWILEARAALERSRLFPVRHSLVLDAFGMAEALVLVAERQYKQSRAKFEQHLPNLRALSRQIPVMSGSLAKNQAYLAIACQQVGDWAAAQSYLREALPLLELHKVEPILSRCKREVPLP